MKLGELCAGYNGLGMAVEEVFGATPAWFSEFDAAPSKILAHHYPDVPNYGDMTKIDWAGIEQADIISGGTPCQDLSAAGRRRGMTEGTRSNLWVQMREAIAIQRPAYVVWENVRGAFSAKAASDLEHCPRCMGEAGHGGPDLRALGRVLGDLSDLGFDAEWRGVRASEVGACHARYRVFVLAKNADITTGGKRGLAAPGQAQGGRTWPDAGGRSGTLATADSDNPRRSEHGGAIPIPPQHTPAQYAGADAAYRAGYEHGWAEALAQSASLGRGQGWAEHARLEGRPDAIERGASLGWGEAIADAAGARRAEGQDGGSGSADAGTGARGIEPERGSGERTNWGAYAAAIHRWERTIGRPAPRPTEPTGRAGAERLSPRFTEWMMGLPYGWVTDPAIGISRNEQLKACGNGVVPQQAAAALRDMLTAFQTQELKETP